MRYEIAPGATPKLSPEVIEGQVACTQYLRPSTCPQVTLAVLTLRNGYVVIGKSAPVCPANFDEGVGRQIAYADAVRQIWALEGYLLREAVWMRDQTPSQVPEVPAGTTGGMVGGISSLAGCTDSPPL